MSIQVEASTDMERGKRGSYAGPVGETARENESMIQGADTRPVTHRCTGTACTDETATLSHYGGFNVREGREGLGCMSNRGQN